MAEPFILTPEEQRVVARALSSSLAALEKMPRHLRPNGETRAIGLLLKRMLGRDWHGLSDVLRFRVK
jgi:hypothetical protein